MQRKMIDLSVPVENGGAPDPAGRPKIEYSTHDQTAADLVKFFPGLKEEDLPDREGWAFERVRLSTHSGTHLDAPYHYASTMDRGNRDRDRRSASRIVFPGGHQARFPRVSRR